MGKSSIVYIDGFNLYYGALKDTPYKWLNLEKCFKLLRQDDDIQRISYFTALLTGDKLVRQQIYLDAIQASPLVKVTYGLFKPRGRKCKVNVCAHSGNKYYSDFEEKGTDVNIAISMLDDASKNLCERIILVSADSDLVPAVNLVKKNFSNIEVVVYIPSRNYKRGAALELREAADKDKTLPQKILAVSQLPPKLIGASGKALGKPRAWNNRYLS